jgi:hypothetical protein
MAVVRCAASHLPVIWQLLGLACRVFANNRLRLKSF